MRQCPFSVGKKHIYPLNTKETWDYLWWVTSHLRGTRTISRFVLKKIHWGPKHNRSCSDAIVTNMNFNSYSSLVIILFFIIPVVFYFFFLFNGSLLSRKSKIKKKIPISFVLFYFMYVFRTFLWIFIIKFGYNAHCHWLKERALWEYRA